MVRDRDLWRGPVPRGAAQSPVACPCPPPKKLQKKLSEGLIRDLQTVHLLKLCSRQILVTAAAAAAIRLILLCRRDVVAVAYELDFNVAK